jgi:Protein of unknown function (DUF3987)
MGWIVSLDREGREGDRQYYLECDEGAGAHHVDRIGRGSSVIGDRFLSILGAFNPDPLAHYLDETLSRGNDGLISRFRCLIWPDEGEYNDIDREPLRQAWEEVDQLFQKLWKFNPDDAGAETDAYDKHVRFLHFAPDAQELHKAWTETLEQQLRGNGHPLLVEHYSKYRSLPAKIALLNHTYDNLNRPQPVRTVSLASLKLAIKWCDYFKSHARRIYYSITNKAERGARALADKILEKELPEVFRLREVYQRHWSGLRTKDDAELAAEILEDAGWLRREDGARRQVIYHVNPGVHKVFGAPKEESAPF